MPGISISGKNKATSKVLSHLCSFMFEQEFGELRNFSSAEKATIREAMNVLAKHA